MKRIAFLLFINLICIQTILAQNVCPADITIDGITYPVVTMGTQCWTSQNMRHAHYADGTAITPAGMVYVTAEQNTLDPTVYGLLYTIEAATRNLSVDTAGNMQGICPDGWHIPTTEEVEILMGEYTPNELMGTTDWLPEAGTNTTGFNMLPAGVYNLSNNSFEKARIFGAFWTTTPSTLVYHECQFGASCGTYEMLLGDPSYCVSVRCVRSAQTSAPVGVCFTALEDGATIEMNIGGTGPDLVYSTNEGITWTQWDGSTITLTNANDKVYIKAGASGNATMSNCSFSTTKQLKVSGNIMRLLNDTITNLTTGTNNNCFNNLFNSTSITDASELELPAMKLANYCYQSMFKNCKKLTTAPALPATTLAKGCYENMFYMDTTGETSNLANAPALPATQLAEGCYCNMFFGCKKLTIAPALPATTLAVACYYQMFICCISLTEAPVLSADTLVDNCYCKMFAHCKKLSEVTMLATDISANDCLIGWLGKAGTDASVSTRTVHVACGMTNAVKATVSNTPDWQTGVQAQDICNLLHFTALENGTTVKFNATNRNLEYSTDGITWASDDSMGIQTLNAGENLFIRATSAGNIVANGVVRVQDEDEPSLYYYVARPLFATTGKLKISGDIMYLLKQDGSQTNLSYENIELPGVGCFEQLFEGCSITDASELILPATSLDGADRCYAAMFKSDTALTAAPTLPATVLTFNCYQNMFDGCSSLAQAPELPATVTSHACYQSMFHQCTSLTTPPALPATTLSTSCYKNMFDSCVNLTSTPVLAAKTLRSSCYHHMFRNCKKIETITMTADTICGSNASNALENWVEDAGTGDKIIYISPNLSATDFVPVGGGETIVGGDVHIVEMNSTPWGWNLRRPFSVTLPTIHKTAGEW